MKAIADTGFLVAFLNSQDQHHAWAEGLAGQVSEPLLTCEPILTEAAYLLNSVPLVLDMLASGLVRLSLNLEENRVHVAELAARFVYRQPDLCDLCVVRMSELFPDHPVITTDRRDFAIYKRNKRQTIPLILPP